MSRIAPQMLITAMALSLAACQQKRHDPELKPHSTLPVAPVRVEKTARVDLPAIEEVVGTVRAKLRATLEAKQSGRIEKLPVSLGDRVEAGGLIAKLDSAETAARLEHAEAAQEQAEREWKRVAALFDQQSATRAERDAAESRLRLARAAVAEATAAFHNTEVLAPFGGVVTKKWVDVGDLALPGKPIVDLEDPALLQVEVDLAESLDIPLTPGSQFNLIGLSRTNATAVLREISPAVDPITRTRRLKLDIDGASAGDSGRFVRVAIPLEHRKALVVSQRAIVERGQLELVYLVENQSARMHLVKTGRKTAHGVEILSGLRADDVVIVENAERVTDGQPVEVKR